MKKLLVFIGSLLLISVLVVSIRYSLKYVHWFAKSGGYIALYDQTDNYPFNQADNDLVNANWKSLATDDALDGDIRNWPDAKELFVYRNKDTIWFALALHNNLDINEPMMSLAIQNDQGRDWYGTVDDFKYKEMISAGYFRKGDKYYGYNFLDQETGTNDLRYDLVSNTLYLGVPVAQFEQFSGKTFVASVGSKGLWNDDFEEPIGLEME